MKKRLSYKNKVEFLANDLIATLPKSSIESYLNTMNFNLTKTYAHPDNIKNWKFYKEGAEYALELLNYPFIPKE
jgi:hypothetical protein